MKLFGNSELYTIGEGRPADGEPAAGPADSSVRSRKGGRAKGRSDGKLSCRTKFGFSLGHFFNDMSGSVWFSYSLLYFKLYFSNSMAGALILVGQVADALATPFIGKPLTENERPRPGSNPDRWSATTSHRKLINLKR